jgi:mono/diheme cytochrome c family protein
MQPTKVRDLKRVPWSRCLVCLALLLVGISALSCNPNPQPEGLTPVPTLAPAATLTLLPALQGTPSGGAASAPTAATAGGETAPTAAPPGGNATNGAALFAQDCAVCHGDGAAGGSVGPSLISTDLKAQSDDFFRQTIANGRPGTGMPAWEGRLSAQEIEDVIAFLRSKQ